MGILTILSGKGGVGKTTITSNLATALASEFNRRVIVLDTNVSSSHIRLHFGMYDKLKQALPDVIEGRADVSKATYLSSVTGVNIVPSSGVNKDLDIEKIKDLAWELAKSAYDWVIIDTSPGFGEDIMNMIKVADRVLVVTTPNIPDVTDALKSVELAKKSKKKVYVILNRVRKKKYELDIDKIKDMLGAEVPIVIPEDGKVPESIAAGVPVVVYSKGSKASITFKKLAATLTGEKYKVSLMDRIKWFLGF